jgi:chromosomal replication initiator protein
MTTITTKSSTSSLELWFNVQSSLHKCYGDATYKSWLKPLSFVSNKGGQVLLAAPTRFIRDWVLSNYILTLTKYWYQEDTSVCSVDICVNSPFANKSNSKGASAAAVNIPVNDGLSSPLDRRFTFANFVVGKSNEFAFTASQRVAKSKYPVVGSNPLFLYGGVGLGKTHLMHATAWYIRNNDNSRKVLYLSAEKFMYYFVMSLREKNVMTFKEQLRSVDVLMIDDVQFISDKDSTQEEFFHTFNSLIDDKKQLVISADRAPNNLSGIEERIRSRLGWGLVADINSTTFELRLGVLKSKLKYLNTHVPDDVLVFLAENIISNIRELEGSLNKVVAHSSIIGKAITLEYTQKILSDLILTRKRIIGIEEIQKKVAEYYSIRISDIHSSKRQRTFVRPRQIAMYLAKDLTTKSLVEIGRHFGGRDHTTVMHAIKSIEKISAADQQTYEDLKNLRAALQSS